MAATATTNMAEEESGLTPDPSDIVTVDVPMPDDYVHELSLTFALFGRPCASEDDDLRLGLLTWPDIMKGRVGAGGIHDAGGDSNDSPAKPDVANSAMITSGAPVVSGAIDATFSV